MYPFRQPAEPVLWGTLYVTSIFTLGAPNEEVQGRQTKLHQGFTTEPPEKVIKH